MAKDNRLPLFEERLQIKVREKYKPKPADLLEEAEGNKKTVKKILSSTLIEIQEDT